MDCRPFLLPWLLAASAATAQEPGTWDFIVRLDGRPVGTHRFELQGDGSGGLKLSSDARFDVKVLGLTVYSYRHRSNETWRNGCLAGIDASTDDGGRKTHVRGQQAAGGFRIEGQDEPVAGCLMTFAYWHPLLPQQVRLLDPGSGRVEKVRIEQLPGARAWRITGLPNPIDIQWDGARWTGLDTVVDGRRLTYRLQ